MAREGKRDCSVSCGCLPPVFAGFAIRGIALFAVVFSEIAICNSRIARAAVSQRGGSPLRLSPGSPPQAAFASFRKSAGSQAWIQILSQPAAEAFVPKPAGRAPLRTGICKFCEPPQGGASARTAEAGLYFYKPRPPRTSFPSTFPRCRQLHIPVCRGVCEQFSSLSF